MMFPLKPPFSLGISLLAMLDYQRANPLKSHSNLTDAFPCYTQKKTKTKTINPIDWWFPIWNKQSLLMIPKNPLPSPWCRLSPGASARDARLRRCSDAWARPWRWGIPAWRCGENDAGKIEESQTSGVPPQESATIVSMFLDVFGVYPETIGM